MSRERNSEWSQRKGRRTLGTQTSLIHSRERGRPPGPGVAFHEDGDDGNSSVVPPRQATLTSGVSRRRTASPLVGANPTTTNCVLRARTHGTRGWAYQIAARFIDPLKLLNSPHLPSLPRRAGLFQCVLNRNISLGFSTKQTKQKLGREKKKKVTPVSPLVYCLSAS